MSHKAVHKSVGVDYELAIRGLKRRPKFALNLSTVNDGHVWGPTVIGVCYGLEQSRTVLTKDKRQRTRTSRILVLLDSVPEPAAYYGAAVHTHKKFRTFRAKTQLSPLYSGVKFSGHY